MVKKCKKRGQSTLEYLILLAMVIAVLILFLRPGGVFEGAYNRTLESGTSGMETIANRLANSH